MVRVVQERQEEKGSSLYSWKGQLQRRAWARRQLLQRTFTGRRTNARWERQKKKRRNKEKKNKKKENNIKMVNHDGKKAEKGRRSPATGRAIQAGKREAADRKFHSSIKADACA